MFHPQPAPYVHTFYTYGYDDGVNEYPAASATGATCCYPPCSDATTLSVAGPPLGLQQGTTAGNFGIGVADDRGGRPTGGGAWPPVDNSARRIIARTGNPSAPAPGISGAPPPASRAAPCVPAVAPHHHLHQSQAQAVFYSQPSFPPTAANIALKAEDPQISLIDNQRRNSRHAVAFSSSIPPSQNHCSTTNFHPHTLNMDLSGTWSTPTPQQTSDMEAQEAAARVYEPEYEGPPVGDKISSQSITEDYAKGNPIYVAKTTALPQIYSHYRPIRGDGNCGWRAIGFAYFESLILSGDANRLRFEHDRIRQLNNYMIQIGGYNEAIWEDMADETFDTFELLSQTIEANPDVATTILIERFSTQGTADAILYHLRLLAASWMKGHAEDFVHFIEDGSGVDVYCSTKIELPGEQIDHLSMMALFKVLLQPARIPLHIAYLDTSPGSQVNSHLNRVDESSPQENPEIEARTIFLLYRPGHYDILYRPNPAAVEVQVNLVCGFDEQHQYSNMGNLQNFSELEMTAALSMIPGSSFLDMGSGPMSPGAPSPLDEYVTSPESPWLARPSYSETESPIQETYQSEEQSSSSGSSATFDTIHPLRFSRYHYQQRLEEAPPPSIPEDDEVEQPAFKTRLFKNSHYNTAHYNNPHFHPEEYDPAAEECPYYARSTVKRRVKIPLRVANDAE